MSTTTTTDPTALTIDGAAATLATLPDSPDVRTAAAMLAAAPTTPVGRPTDPPAPSAPTSDPVFVTFTDEEGDPGSVIGPFVDAETAREWIASIPAEVRLTWPGMATRIAWQPAEWVADREATIASWNES